MFPNGAAYGWAAGVLCTIGYGLYLWGLIKNPGFAPESKNLLIWAVVSALSALSFGEAGAESSLLTPILDAGWPLVIAVICWKKNDGMNLNQSDVGVIAITLLGLGAWQALNAPLACLGVCIMLDWHATKGIIAVARKAPRQEPFWSWLATTAACALNLAAAAAEAGSSTELLVYPVSCLLIAGLVLAVIWLGLLCRGLSFPQKQQCQMAEARTRCGLREMFCALSPAFAPIWLPEWAASGDI